MTADLIRLVWVLMIPGCTGWPGLLVARCRVVSASLVWVAQHQWVGLVRWWWSMTAWSSRKQVGVAQGVCGCGVGVVGGPGVMDCHAGEVG